MKFLSGIEEREALKILTTTGELVGQATCLRSKCGSIIIATNNIIIGRGSNSPPRELETQRRCLCEKTEYNAKVTDKTCCIHTEQRAIIDALQEAPLKIIGSRLYFARLSADGHIARSAAPYCTLCSKLALDVGIGEFVLWHADGICVYDTEEYNMLSFNYGKENSS